MNCVNSAISFIKDAQIILEEAYYSQERHQYHRVVRKCQEASELAIKGLFKYFSIEYPKAHILGRTIRKKLVNLNILSDDELEKIIYYCDSLAFERETSFYGTNDGISAAELYDIDDAKKAITYSQFIIETVIKSIKIEKNY